LLKTTIESNENKKPSDFSFPHHHSALIYALKRIAVLMR